MKIMQNNNELTMERVSEKC